MMKTAVVESWQRVVSGRRRSLQYAWFGQLPQHHVIYRFYHQVGGPLRLLSFNIWGEVENRQVEPGGGWRWSGGEAFIFEEEVNCLWLGPVLGGVICPVRWHPPDNGRKLDFGLEARKWKWILESDSLWWNRQHHIYVVFDILSSVLDKESVDLKVLVQ